MWWSDRFKKIFTLIAELFVFNSSALNVWMSSHFILKLFFFKYRTGHAQKQQTTTGMRDSLLVPQDFNILMLWGHLHIYFLWICDRDCGFKENSALYTLTHSNTSLVISGSRRPSERSDKSGENSNCEFYTYKVNKTFRGDINSATPVNVLPLTCTGFHPKPRTSLTVPACLSPNSFV